MKLYIVLLALAVATGCSGGGSDGKGGGAGGAGGIPGDIDLKLDGSQALNATQLQEAQAFMKTDGKKLPDNSLLYTSDGDSQKRKKEEKISKLDSEGRANFKMMKDNCTVKDREEKKISGPEKGVMPKAGDVTVTEVSNSISGRSCPVAASEVSRTKVTVLDFNLDSNTKELNKYVMNIEATGVVNSEVRNQSFIRLNNGRVRMSMEISMNGVFDYSKELRRTYYKMAAKGKMDSASGAFSPIQVDMESLGKEDSSGKNSGKVVTKLTVQMPTFTLVVQTLEETIPNRDKIRKFYVNGREFSAEQIKDLLGDSFEVTSSFSSEK